MCSSYWNLRATVVCPTCGLEAEDDLQTHDFGEMGSCVNYYRLGEPVEELANVERGYVTLTAVCQNCARLWDLRGIVEDHRVVDLAVLLADGG